MKILNGYVTRGFLLAFVMAIAILTFGMLGGNLLKVLKYISQGAPFSSFVTFTLYILPVVLTYTIPWAVMVAVMLVFGRLSADSEITAMRACGVSIMQIVSPILILTFGLTVCCLYLQAELGPPLLGKARDQMKISILDNPIAIFQPGRPIIYEGNLISIADKVGENIIKGVQIYTLEDKETLAQDISAASGELNVDEEKQEITITLFDCIAIDKKADPEFRSFNDELTITIDYGKNFNKIQLTERAKYMNIADLMALIRTTKLAKADTTALEVELNQRIAFALSPIAFLLIGLPLAIRTSRRETSVGLFLSVGLAGGYFLLIILCDSFTSFPEIYPQYLLWVPNILFQVLGAVMTYRISQR